MKVQQLIQILTELDPEAEVFAAVQPEWPFEHALYGVAVRRDFTEVEEIDEDDEAPEFTGDRWSARADMLPGNDVILVVGEQLRYGTRDAWEAAQRA